MDVRGIRRSSPVAPLASAWRRRGGAVRLVDRDGNPGSVEAYSEVVAINHVGTFNALRLAAARMVRNEPLDGDRGVCVLTASAAAYEGQIGQMPYASAKAGIVGM